MTKTITYSKEFFEKKFTADTMKSAYLKACKWYATNVLSKAELKNVQVEFEKEKDEQKSPTVTIHLFAVLNEEELRERHCKICREFHSSFFINTQFNCDKCDTKAYQRRADDMIGIKVSYYKEVIAKRAEEDF